MQSGVTRWFDATDEDELFLSVLTLGELRMGALGLARKGPAGAPHLGAWVNALHTQYAGKILPVTMEIVEKWAELSVPDRLPVVDGLLAATAIVHGHILVTRNTATSRVQASRSSIPSKTQVSIALRLLVPALARRATTPDRPTTQVRHDPRAIPIPSSRRPLNLDSRVLA